MVRLNRPELSLDTKVHGSEDVNRLHCRILSTYIDTVSAILTPAEVGLIKGRLRNGDLLNAIPPEVYSRLEQAKTKGNMSVTDFQHLYQLCSFFKKLPTKGSEAQCKDVAFKKLLQGEESCRIVNQTISYREATDFALFDRVKRIIYDILGDLPPDFLRVPFSFGPGSSVNANKRSFEESGKFYKLSDKLIVPDRAKNYLAAHLSSNEPWVDALAVHYRTQKNTDESRLSYELRIFRKHLIVVPDDTPSRISFVPKNKDEHRTIGIEMNGLMILQKVVGDLIRKKLRDKTPINLNSQERNRHLARLAKTFGLATIDLANASNSISLALVRALLPYDWFCVISDFRSSHGICPSIQSEKIEYEMVSSMGNGFTFELESLIFYALAVASCEKDGIHPSEIKKSVGVFGDDIIVPQISAPTLIEGMTLFGFTVNEDKSFLKGFFFESCGADYYDGVDVRPFLIKRQVSTFRDLLFVMNSLLFKAIKQKRADFVDLYAMLFKLIPDKKLLGPIGYTSQEVTDQFTDKFDDLEAVLRVPLNIAQHYGAVRFDVRLQCWRYKKWVRVSLTSDLGSSPDYFVKNIRYLTFLDGSLGGMVTLRGRTRDRQKTDTSSNWNGCLSVDELRYVDLIFSGLQSY